MNVINVSRTPVSEAWLASLPLAQKGHQPLDPKAVFKIQQSRFSVATINTDLFPELISWSTVMSAESSTESCSPYSQDFPSDIGKHGDSDTLTEMSLSLSAIFDPTTIDIGFDSSCFEGLDDVLIYSPMSAFAEVCWADFVGLEESYEHPSTPTPPRPTTQISEDIPRFSQTRSPMVTSYSSDDSDTDSDECLTYREDTSKAILGTGLSRRVGDFSSYELPLPKTICLDDDDAKSFMIVDARFPTLNSVDSVGSFPVRPIRHRKSVSSRISAFRAHLMPGRLTFVRPPPS